MSEMVGVKCPLCDQWLSGYVQYNHWRTKPEPSVFMMLAHCELCDLSINWPSSIPYQVELQR